MRRIHVGIIIRNLINDLARKNQRRKKYRSWAAAVRASKTDYEHERLTKFRIERSRGILGAEERYVNPPSEVTELLGRLNGGAFVDFGGSAGEMCCVLKVCFPEWNFTVVETPAIAEAASLLRPEISFSESLPDDITFFYSSGTLQYLEDPYKLWGDALRKTTGFAFLARNTFSNKPHYRVQYSMLFSNGAGPVPHGFDDVVTKYPHQAISEEKLMRTAKENGFELVERFPNRNSGLVQGAADLYGADLLFRRTLGRTVAL